MGKEREGAPSLFAILCILDKSFKGFNDDFKRGI